MAEDLSVPVANGRFVEQLSIISSTSFEISS